MLKNKSLFMVTSREYDDEDVKVTVYRQEMAAKNKLRGSSKVKRLL